MMTSHEPGFKPFSELPGETAHSSRMERDDRFSFKLLVPQWVNDGKVSGVSPQKIVNCGDFVDTLKHGHTKVSNKELRVSSSSTNKPAAAQQIAHNRPEMAALPLMEKHESDCSPGLLCSKLFDEVEKLKCWNIKVSSEAVKKEKQLQENKKTIESQCKAIQDLQIGNERLNIKLDEQMSENKDLRSKCTTTRNLFNTLKESIQRSTKKMDLFQSERKGTDNHLMEHNESVQKLTAAYETLCAQAEADHQNIEKVKEDLQQFEDLKNKHQQECSMKDKETAELRIALKDKGNELQTILLSFHESQKNCEDLRQEINFQQELLQSSKRRQEDLLQELHLAEQCSKETLEKHAAIEAMLDQSKEEYTETIRSKDMNLEELMEIKNQQAEKLQQMLITINGLQDSHNLEIQRGKELEEKLLADNTELERRNTLLEESMEVIIGQIKVLEEDLDVKSKSIESMKGKIDVSEGRVQELEAELSRKLQDAELFKSKVEELEGLEAAENKKKEELIFQIEQQQKDISKHEAKQEELLSNLNELQCERAAIEQQLKTEDSRVKATEANLKMSEEKVETFTKKIERLEEENYCLREEVNFIKTKSQGESEKLQKKTEEDHERLQEQIREKEKEIKALEAQVNSLHEEYKKLQRLNEEKHQKIIEDFNTQTMYIAELKNEIEKLKSTAAEAIKKKEDTELKCQNKISDMVLLMEKHKSQYDRIVKKKDTELDENRKKEMEAADNKIFLELELNKQKAENNHLKQQLKAEMTEKQNVQKELSDLQKEVASLKITHQRIQQTPKEGSSVRHVMDPIETSKTPIYSKDDRRAAVCKKVEMHNEDKKTLQENRVCKSYRIKTPPSTLVAKWKNSIVEHDSSDNSEQNDTLGFGSAPNFSASLGKLNTFPKVPSHPYHSPSSSLLRKIALKRIRNAGWTALTAPDKKKKMCFEEIFE